MLTSVAIAALLLVGCGSGGSGTNPPPQTHTIGGTVSGLSGTGLVLQNNGGNNLSISGNGSFTFSTAIAAGGAYSVAVLTQPSNPVQTCTVANGTGTANANVTNVQVSCATTAYTIGGTVSGLSGTGLVLQNNGSNNLSISGNGSFTFSTAVTAGSTYNVTILTQPSTPAQTCTVANGGGTANMNVTSVEVSCAVTYTIGGTVSALSGTGLVLENDGGDNLPISVIASYPFPFTFSAAVTAGSTYNVTVLTQPSNPAQKCTVANGSGTANANVTSVQVGCASPFTLFSFDGTDGGNPATALVQGTDGNLYGTTGYGGANTGCPYGCGTFFRISTSGELTTLYNFCSQANCTDGWAPSGPLVLGIDGNFYGITEFGGTGSAGCPSPANCGTVFKVTANGTLTTIYNWCSQPNCADGNYELLSEPGPFVQASDGNFYGVNDAGGAGYGTAFKLTPSGTLTTLHNWCSEPNCADGWDAANGLIQATDGNFYGTTYRFGANGLGTFFKMTPSGTLTTLYNFCSLGGSSVCTDGGFPFGPLTQASNGDFYGTTSYGGANLQSAACMAQGITGGYCGTVFEITASGTLTTLYNFCSQPNCTDGASPGFQLVQASDGNLYGVTLAGGDPSCPTANIPLGPGCGTIFKLTKSGALTTLQVLDSEYQNPEALFQATLGTFYGETVSGGGYGSCFADSTCGTVFSVAAGLPPFVETVPTTGQVGAAVSILGTNLTGATSVTFNGTAAVFTIESDTYINATVPTGATTGTVSVVTPSGTLSSNVNFVVSN